MRTLRTRAAAGRRRSSLFKRVPLVYITGTARCPDFACSRWAVHQGIDITRRRKHGVRRSRQDIGKASYHRELSRWSSGGILRASLALLFMTNAYHGGEQEMAYGIPRQACCVFLTIKCESRLRKRMCILQVRIAVSVHDGIEANMKLTGVEAEWLVTLCSLRSHSISDFTPDVL